jgi:hypothetical protein
MRWHRPAIPGSNGSSIVAACGLALILHVILLFVVLPKISLRLHGAYNQEEYADGYDQLAANLVSGNGYRMLPDTAETLMREPAYPILLAGIFSVFGNDFTAVKVVNMLMAFAVAWLMTRLARDLSTDPSVIFGPPLLFLFHPGTLVAESRGGVEVLFTLLVVLFISTLNTAVKRNGTWDYIVSGAVLGLTILVRSTPILFPAALLAYLLVFKREDARRVILRNVSVMVVAMFVVLSPWIIRNYSLTGQFVPTASVVGVSAQTGQYILTHHSSDDRRTDREAAAVRNDAARDLGYPFKHGYYQYFYSSKDELRFSNYLLKSVFDEYRRSPGLFFRVIGMNLMNFWIGGKTGDSVKMNVILQVPFLILAIVGAALAIRNGQVDKVAPMLIFMTYIIGISLPILAQARYSVPLIPFLSIFVWMTLTAAGRRYVGGWIGLQPAVTPQ